jgi:hypothetical protein
MEINNYDYIADLYDIYVPVTFDIDFFVRETKKSSGEVLELMSGTGRVSIPLLEAGVNYHRQRRWLWHDAPGRRMRTLGF